MQVAQIDLTAMQEQYTKDVKAQVGQDFRDAASDSSVPAVVVNKLQAGLGLQSMNGCCCY